MHIWRAGSADLEAVAPLFDAYRQFYGQEADLPAARAFIGARLAAADSTIFVAALSDESGAVGFVQLYPSFSSVSMATIWILNDLYVDEQARRNGVARALLERAAGFGAETGAKSLALSTAHGNSQARQLYEAMGWRLETEFVDYNLTIPGGV